MKTLKKNDPCYFLLFALLFATPGFAAAAVTVDSGTTAWMLTSTVLVLLMIPGLAMFYGGLSRTKNVLGTMLHSFAALAVVGVLWVVIGYALAFGKGALGGFIGWDSGLLFLQSIDEKILESSVPEYVFAMFQGKFAIIAPALMAGAVAERVSFKGYCLLIALWSIFVYDPICHWVWATDGFLFKLGAIDFAGGTVVHISSGVSGLIAALYLGPRVGFPKTSMHPSHLVMTLMGVGLLWVGWFGFNAGSGISSNLLTAQALTATQVAAATGALSWIIIELFHLKKITSLGMASGILSGLVTITPAAGVVAPIGAMALGAVASAVCYVGLIVKSKLGYDDSLDAFGIHGVAGIIGAVGLTFFIRTSTQNSFIAAAQAKGENWSVMDQLGYQLVGVGVTIVYSAVVTYLLVLLVEKVVGLKLSDSDQKAGMDHALHGEHGYGFLNLN
jgi:Amt family ammonium transporter